MISYQKIFSKKSLITILFIVFSVFWFGDFLYAFFYMILYPIIFYFYEKNNGKIKDITENHSYVVFSTSIIVIAYIGFMIQYLSLQNPNKIFNKNSLIIETYSILEYKSVRTRSDHVLLVKNEYNNQAIDCSAFTYGRCPYAHQYGDYIDIGFVKVRKNFSRFVYGIDNGRIAYYIKYGNEVIPSEYFIKKYDGEMKRIYQFLISLNLYMIFLYYIKNTYQFNLYKSFSYVISNKEAAKHCAWVIANASVFPIFFLFF